MSISEHLFRKKSAPPVPQQVTGLILSGGGARAAYQVGVLKAVADLWPQPDDNPFQVIVGTSAGAINAVSLACGASHFKQATRQLDSGQVRDKISCAPRASGSTLCNRARTRSFMR